MKTFVIERNENGLPPESWYFLPDSAITNPGKPFFIPEMTDTIEAQALLALKINRLGKTIAPRFAHRYFSEVALGIHFTAPLLKKELLEKGLSPDRSRGFDRSLFLTEFIPCEEFSKHSEISFLKNGELTATLSPDLSDDATGDCFAAISAENTLKMGDILIPHLSRGIRINIGDTLEIRKDTTPLLRIEIK